LSTFTIRVYGICINEHHQILLSDEKYHDQYFTKFPGGGLQYGEGTIDCLKREFNEEYQLQIKITEHFYTTDFFVPSAFHQRAQILSIYYFIELLGTDSIIVSTTKLNLNNDLKQDQKLRWVPLELLFEDSVDFPIDKFVVEKILNPS
jgi:8-oxo-dGTP diphosphatase